MKTITSLEFAHSIIARHTRFLSGAVQAADLLFPVMQIMKHEAPPDGFAHSLRSIRHITHVINENNVYPINISLNFLQSILAKTVREFAQSTVRHLHMLEKSTGYQSTSATGSRAIGLRQDKLPIQSAMSDVHATSSADSIALRHPSQLDVLAHTPRQTAPSQRMDRAHPTETSATPKHLPRQMPRTDGRRIVPVEQTSPADAVRRLSPSSNGIARESTAALLGVEQQLPQQKNLAALLDVERQLPQRKGTAALRDVERELPQWKNIAALLDVGRQLPLWHRQLWRQIMPNLQTDGITIGAIANHPTLSSGMASPDIRRGEHIRTHTPPHPDMFRSSTTQTNPDSPIQKPPIPLHMPVAVEKPQQQPSQRLHHTSKKSPRTTFPQPEIANNASRAIDYAPPHIAQQDASAPAPTPPILSQKSAAHVPQAAHQLIRADIALPKFEQSDIQQPTPKTLLAKKPAVYERLIMHEPIRADVVLPKPKQSATQQPTAKTALPPKPTVHERLIAHQPIRTDITLSKFEQSDTQQPTAKTALPPKPTVQAPLMAHQPIRADIALSKSTQSAMPPASTKTAVPQTASTHEPLTTQRPINAEIALPRSDQSGILPTINMRTGAPAHPLNVQPALSHSHSAWHAVPVPQYGASVSVQHPVRNPAMRNTTIGNTEGRVDSQRPAVPMVYKQETAPAQTAAATAKISASDDITFIRKTSHSASVETTTRSNAAINLPSDATATPQSASPANLQEQVNVMADQIYGAIERRLRSERMRRGLF